MVKNLPTTQETPGLIPGSGRSPRRGIGYPLQYSWASLAAQLVKNLPAMQETLVDSWVGKICWRRARLPTPVFLGFPCGSAGKEYARSAGDLGSIPGLGRFPGEAKGFLTAVFWPGECHGLYSPWVAKSQTKLSDFHFTIWQILFMGFSRQDY